MLFAKFKPQTKCQSKLKGMYQLFLITVYFIKSEINHTQRWLLDEIVQMNKWNIRQSRKTEKSNDAPSMY